MADASGSSRWAVYAAPLPTARAGFFAVRSRRLRCSRDTSSVLVIVLRADVPSDPTTNGLRAVARRLPGLRLRYETLDRLGDLQREVRQLQKQLVILQGRAEISVPSVPDRDERFTAAAAAVGKRTKLDEDRLWILWQAARNAALLELPLLEAGSYRGGSAWFLANAVRERLGRELPLEAVDTFEGHPQEAITASDHAYHEAGRFGDVSYQRVREYLSEFALATVHRGEFSTVAPGLPHSSYGLAHLDMDLYRPTREALIFSSDRMPVGAIVVVDDYGSPKCPGIEQAVQEFLAVEPGFQAWHPHTEQVVLIRVA
jgi:O-methyltransferase